MSALRFLVVDDAAFIRDMVKRTLRDHLPGCEVFDASDGRKAMTLLRQQPVEMILCDWEMPEVTGEELLRWVREQDALAKIPFIMVSSRGERDYVVRAVQAGATDYIGKPFKPELLLSKIKKGLAKAGIQWQPKRQLSSVPQGVAQASLEALMGSAPQPAAPKAPVAPPPASSAALLTGAAPAVAAPPAKRAAPAKRSPKGQAQLNFAGFVTQCVISDLSLQLMKGVIKRDEQLPSLLESAVVSIVSRDGEQVARLNAYVHALEAGEAHMNCSLVKVTLRFVDNDPQKFEHLSRYIASC